MGGNPISVFNVDAERNKNNTPVRAPVMVEFIPVPKKSSLTELND